MAALGNPLRPGEEEGEGMPASSSSKPPPSFNELLRKEKEDEKKSRPKNREEMLKKAGMEKYHAELSNHVISYQIWYIKPQKPTYQINFSQFRAIDFLRLHACWMVAGPYFNVVSKWRKIFFCQLKWPWWLFRDSYQADWYAFFNLSDKFPS